MTQPNASLPPPAQLRAVSNSRRHCRKHSRMRRGHRCALKAQHPRFASATDEQIAQTPLKLRDAQLVIAREYGFEHWAAMKQHIASLQNQAGSEFGMRELIQSAAKGDLAAVAHPRCESRCDQQLGGDDRSTQRLQDNSAPQGRGKRTSRDRPPAARSRGRSGHSR